MSDEFPTNSSAGDVPPGPDKPPKPSRKGMGGPAFHNPFCKCNPCKARRRREEAEFGPTGARGRELAAQPIPEKGITTVTGLKKAAPKQLRERVAQYLQTTMAFPNAPKSEIAKRMGLSSDRLYNIIKEGIAQKLIHVEDPLERIDYEIIPKIVDNINYFLDAKDKTVTIEAAKGTIFKSYAESKGFSEGNQTVLALKIEMPDGQDVKLISGHIVGRPKELTEVVEAEEI